MPKSLSVKDKIYERLTELKCKRMSYSDVIEDLLPFARFRDEAEDALKRFMTENSYADRYEALTQILKSVADEQQKQDWENKKEE